MRPILINLSTIMEPILTNLFIQIFNMSVTAGYVIIAILLIRFLLKKAPKKYSYALWSVVGFRLLCPFSFQSVFSLFQFKLFDMRAAQQQTANRLTYVPEYIGMMAEPQITTGIPSINAAINPTLPAATLQYSANPMQLITIIGMYLWLIGMAILLIYSLVSLIRLALRVRTAVRLEGNVYQSERIRSPFVLGIIRPKIYIPYALDSAAQAYVLAHERFHIRHLDHLVKILAFLLLCVHWFNPLCWVAFVLMSRDMEMRCDEWVLTQSDDIRKAYSTTLLSFAANRRFPAPTPLAFGEGSIRGRIKNALRWKKPAL